MGYISESPGFGEYGCGSGCSCSGCRRGPALGEIYTYEKQPEPMHSQPPSAPGSPVGELPRMFYKPRRLRRGVPAIPQNLSSIRGWTPARLGEPSLGKRYEPWRVRIGLRVPPQHLSFLNLNQFKWNQASLTPRLLQMLRHLAEHVRVSWNSMRPIGFIRLVGHTDNTGQEQYNVDLGSRRAQAVKDALENLLKEEIAKRRVAISVEKSPGVKEPVADNRTQAGRALNRRVEVYVAPPLGAPPSKRPDPPKPDPPPPPEPQPSYWTPIPPGRPGKSFKQWLDERLKWVPKLLRNTIWDAVVGKDFSLLSTLLDQAGVIGAEKNAILESARQLGEKPTR
jgi:outer membrane protein OmpA-like peptidoglycan-associated protein